MPKIIDSCRTLRTELLKLRDSPMLLASPTARSTLRLTGSLLEEIEDLADRVTLIEIAIASSTETIRDIPALTG